MATDARSVRAIVKRARFAFTVPYLRKADEHRSIGSRAVSVVTAEIPGFASPSRGGFALDNLAM
jgi:hypothetical protein